MTRTQRDNALAMVYLTAIAPVYVLFHPKETRENWRNGR